MAHRGNMETVKPDNKKKGIRALIITILATLPLCILFWQLFIAFGRANIFGFGGGPAVIPLIQREVVNNYKVY